MNLSELAPGIILFLIGLVILLVALLGTGSNKTFKIPGVDVRFSSPYKQGQKIILAVLGLLLMAMGIAFLAYPIIESQILNNTPSPTVSIATLMPTSADVNKQTPEPIIISTSTLIPTMISTATAIPDIENGCISATYWLPFDGESLPINDLNCWQMQSWGIVANNGELLISAEKVEKSHGFYRVISNNTKITLSVQIDRMHTVYSLEPRLMLGIIPLSPLKPSDGKYLLLQRESVEDTNIYVKLRDPVVSKNDKYLPFRYLQAETHKVTFVIDDLSMKIYLDDEKATEPISLPFSERAFWIGYELPPQTSIQVLISDISFDVK